MIYIQGDYAEMAPFISRLRSVGFDFDRRAKAWFGCQSDLSRFVGNKPTEPKDPPTRQLALLVFGTLRIRIDRLA